MAGGADGSTLRSGEAGSWVAGECGLAGVSGPLPPGSLRASPARLALSARLPGPLAMSLSSSASALRLSVPPRLFKQLLGLALQAIEIHGTSWFAAVVGHYDKSPGSNGGRNHRRLAARRRLLRSPHYRFARQASVRACCDSMEGSDGRAAWSADEISHP